MMISIFKCESQDDSYDLVFSKDCTKSCYKGKHLLYSISGGLLIIIYLFLSTLLRPYWELQQSHLNIKTKPSFFSYLSIFQYISILCKVTIDKSYNALQGYIVSCFILCLIILTLKLKPFNYERLNIFQIMILSIDFWIMIVSSTELIIEYERQMILSMLWVFS